MNDMKKGTVKSILMLGIFYFVFLGAWIFVVCTNGKNVTGKDKATVLEHEQCCCDSDVLFYQDS